MRYAEKLKLISRLRDMRKRLCAAIDTEVDGVLHELIGPVIKPPLKGGKHGKVLGRSSRDQADKGDS